MLIGFAILPVRAALYTLSDNSTWFIGVQLLDGVGAGIFGAIRPLLLADLMHSTGPYNIAQGAVAAVQGIGAFVCAALSIVPTVRHADYLGCWLE